MVCDRKATRVVGRLLLATAFMLAAGSGLPLKAEHAPDNSAEAVREAQQNRRTVTGRVVDEQGNPVPGTTVLIQGAGTGVTADGQGNYAISASSGDVLEFSFLGMKKVTETVGSRDRIDVVLEEDGLMIDPVVAIGYGSMRKSDLTGAVASVTSESIARSGAVSLDQALQGRAAGVQMTTNTGMPGGGTSIQIRGIKSINSTNEPIYIIDGVTISAGTGTYTDNAISGINPSDIESMEILKDASATAIYGAQGANGVIIITTKSGRAGQPRVSFEAQYGIQTLPKYLDMMDLHEYAQHHNEYQALKGWELNNNYADPNLLSNGTNWQKEIFRTAAQQNYNFSVSGGTETNTYKISGNYLDQDGVAAGSGFERMTMTVGLDSKIKPWLRFGGTLTLTQTKQEITIAEWGLISSAVKQAPSVPAKNLDGTYGGPEDSTDSYANPLALANLLTNNNKKRNTRGNIYLDITPVDWLALRSEFGIDLGQTSTNYFVPTYEVGRVTNSEIQNQKTQSQSTFYKWNNTATFRKTIERHTGNLMVGQEVTESTNNYLMGKRLDGSNQLTDLSAGDAATATNEGYTGRTRYVSVFGRLFYSYDDRYLLTATIRRDGSSNFAKGYKWGNFPSVSVAWRMSNEAFLKDFELLTNMKLRLGYGQVGNSNITSFAYAGMLSNIPTVFGTGHLTANIPNPEVTWETTTSYNIGYDLGLWKNRIELTADVYYNRTDDLLLALTLPGITGTLGTNGASAPWGNVGSMSNKGVELSINTVNITRNDFEWRSNFVFTMNRNKVIKLNAEQSYINTTYQVGGTDYVVTRTEEGRSVGEFWGYKIIGRINSASDIYDSNGNIKIALPEGVNVAENGVWIGDYIYEDYNGDGVITEEDRQYLGSPLPKFTGGFGNTFTWKNFDLNVYLTFSYGNKVMNFLGISIDNPNNTENITRRAGTQYARLALIDENGSSSDIWNVYVASGDKNISRMSTDDANSNANRISSRYIEDGSYLRIQSVSLAYNIPKKYIGKIGMESLRVYINMNNLFTFSKYTGYDPEVGMARNQYSNWGQNPLLNGVDTGRYPSPRTFTFGVQIGF